jgi:hypothetical protein
MAKKTNTEVATVETKKAVPAKTEKTNAEKVNEILTMEDINKLYADLGIKCYNPAAKGKYRIMGNQKGSSLNVTKKEYTIYTTETDYQNVLAANLKNEDLALEENTNNDKVRSNVVRCKTIETLKTVLAVFASNPINQLVTA